MSAISLPIDAYWEELELGEDDLELILNLLLEREVPLTTDEMLPAIIDARLEEYQSLVDAEAATEVVDYRPENSYKAGDRIRFPASGYIVGTVMVVREGKNPDLGSFDVIELEIDDRDGSLEFAANLKEHNLNVVEEDESIENGPSAREEIFEEYGDRLHGQLQTLLADSDGIVQIARRWFPEDLLVELDEGDLNIAEAVLDMAGGGPLGTKELLEPIEVQDNVDPLLAEFSMDYLLQEDERFDEVGPAGIVLWYLRKLEPPEVLFIPPRLAYDPAPEERSLFSDELLDLEIRLDDELSPVPDQNPGEDVVIPLPFPHWRVGTLPLSPRLRAFFPTAYEAPRIRFILIDGHSGTRFPGWVVRDARYVYGLDEFYRQYDIPAGGLLRVYAGDEMGEVVVEAVERKTRSEWVRTVTISDDYRIGFAMSKQSLGTSYDERMVVSLEDPAKLDQAWLSGSQRNLSFRKLVSYVFDESAKLNPQLAVHSEALYSGLNVFRRTPPAPIFIELINNERFEFVGDHYWQLADQGQDSID